MKNSTLPASVIAKEQGINSYVKRNGSYAKKDNPYAKRKNESIVTGNLFLWLTAFLLLPIFNANAVSVDINGNSQFTASNGVSSGNGTAANPYIIQGKTFSAPSFMGYGVFIQNTTAYFVIKNCKANGFFGFGLLNVSNGKIENCESLNSHNPIDIDGSSNNEFTYNTFTGATGMYIYSGSNNNLIAYNLLEGSTDGGIYMKSCSNNIIHHNQFINNGTGSSAQAKDDKSTNQWDDGTEGNYWSDWTSPDVDGNGIVDIPYLLVSSAGAKDNYPLTGATVGIADANIASKHLVIHQNTPNPFSTTTQINYTLNKKSNIEISVYTLTGKEVKVLKNVTHNAGTYSITWDGKDAFGREMAGGIYLFRFHTEKSSQTMKIVLAR